MKNTIPKGLKYNELVKLLAETGYIKVTKDQVLSIDSPMVNFGIIQTNKSYYKLTVLEYLSKSSW